MFYFIASRANGVECLKTFKIQCHFLDALICHLKKPHLRHLIPIYTPYEKGILSGHIYKGTVKVAGVAGSYLDSTEIYGLPANISTFLAI